MDLKRDKEFLKFIIDLQQENHNLPYSSSMPIYEEADGKEMEQHFLSPKNRRHKQGSNSRCSRCRKNYYLNYHGNFSTPL